MPIRMPPVNIHIMEQRDQRPSSVTSAISSTISRYIKLLLEDTRLNIAEKLTRLFSALTVCALVLALALATLLFLSIAAGIALANVMNPIGAYVIVGSVYAVLAVVVFLCKTPLIVNPIARFISRLLLDAPENTQVVHDKSSSIS